MALTSISVGAALLFSGEECGLKPDGLHSRAGGPLHVLNLGAPQCALCETGMLPSLAS